MPGSRRAVSSPDGVTPRRLASREAWKEAAQQRLREALDAAWGGRPVGMALRLMIIRGEPGPALIDVASFTGDLLVVGPGGAARWRGSGVAG